jgi:hypothetical protein
MARLAGIAVLASPEAVVNKSQTPLGERLSKLQRHNGFPNSTCGMNDYRPRYRDDVFENISMLLALDRARELLELGRGGK